MVRNVLQRGQNVLCNVGFVELRGKERDNIQRLDLDGRFGVLAGDFAQDGHQLVDQRGCAEESVYVLFR